ncbi:MAG: HGGxSTG domain-containing protein [Shewanella sp.]
MAKFDLNNLPKCGAKTRAGTPCQRYGNKSNGRCKLHGGRSTGAKTKEGKLAVRVNPLLNYLTWFCDNHFYLKIKISDAEKALKAYFQLTDLLALDSIEHVHQAREASAIIEENRVELEMTKYYIAECHGPTALLVIQSALDQYYKECDSPHLHFHLHTPIYPAPFFHNYFCSKAENKMMSKTLVKSIKKQGVFYSPRVKSSPMQKELKRRVKELKKFAKEVNSMD